MDYIAEKETTDMVKINDTSKSNIVSDALDFATKKHKGQYRKGKNKVEYINHPKNVCKLITRFKGNSKNIEILKAAAILHDTLEDTDTSYSELVNKFGVNVASLVLELTTDNDMKNKLGKAKYLAIKMKNMTNYALDIKLCDRLDNIEDLHKTNMTFTDKYINETLYIIRFLIENRKLTSTQINIIKTIINVLDQIITNKYDDDSKESHYIQLLTTNKEIFS